MSFEEYLPHQGNRKPIHPVRVSFYPNNCKVYISFHKSFIKQSKFCDHKKFKVLVGVGDHEGVFILVPDDAGYSLSLDGSSRLRVGLAYRGEGKITMGHGTMVDIEEGIKVTVKAVPKTASKPVSKPAPKPAPKPAMSQPKPQPQHPAPPAPKPAEPSASREDDEDIWDEVPLHMIKDPIARAREERRRKSAERAVMEHGL